MDSKRAISVTILALAAAVSCSRPSQKEAPPSAEGKAYASKLQLSEVTMHATESYSKQVVTEIEGKVTNTGDRTVDFADVACVFYDSIGQMVLREEVTIVKRELKPGETRSFRLPFDDIPASWNNQMPQLVIARIRLS
ncbi:MAG: FxLYD domain-containing protein [Bryobacteraceae bacterium]